MARWPLGTPDLIRILSLEIANVGDPSGSDVIMGESKPRAPKGKVVINIERCKGCGFCAQYCPTGVLDMGNSFNRKGYHPPIAAHPEKCSGCDLCGMYCPDFAIYGVKFNKA